MWPRAAYYNLAGRRLETRVLAGRTLVVLVRCGCPVITALGTELTACELHFAYPQSKHPSPFHKPRRFMVQGLILSDNSHLSLPAATSPCVWAVGCVGCVNTRGVRKLFELTSFAATVLPLG